MRGELSGARLGTSILTEIRPNTTYTGDARPRRGRQLSWAGRRASVLGPARAPQRLPPDHVPVLISQACAAHRLRACAVRLALREGGLRLHLKAFPARARPHGHVHSSRLRCRHAGHTPRALRIRARAAARAPHSRTRALRILARAARAPHSRTRCVRSALSHAPRALRIRARAARALSNARQVSR